MSCCTLRRVRSRSSRQSPATRCDRPFPVEGTTTDEIIENRVRAERGDPFEMRERWRVARRMAVDALRKADPNERFPWIAATLRPAALATTRLAEHWAHALDIAEPLGVDHPDTDRLRHIAWLGHRTLPYGFELAGEQPQPVYAELTSPGGETWTYGDADAPSRIVGTAGDVLPSGCAAAHAGNLGPCGNRAVRRRSAKSPPQLRRLASAFRNSRTWSLKMPSIPSPLAPPDRDATPARPTRTRACRAREPP